MAIIISKWNTSRPDSANRLAETFCEENWGFSELGG